MQPRANAAFVVLARNKELEGVIQSIKSIERHFNRWFHYPYVFLNDGDFEQSFKDGVTNYTSAPAEFGKIDPSMWGYPDWVDHEVAREGIRKQGDAAIMYGGMESYHHMCRFYSGFFYKHELLAKYEWYWRLEPEIKYFCDITYDPFVRMAEANKTYGFTIAVKELKETVPNIFRYASAYKRKHKLKSKGLWEMFLEPAVEDPKLTPEAHRAKTLPDEILLTEPGHQNIEEIDEESMEGEKYNMCHFWSNFEIARLDWFRSKEYNEFFDMMDRSGGFWMERVKAARNVNVSKKDTLTIDSGVTHRFILLQRELFSHQETFTTSGTLGTDIRRFNIVRPMRQRDSWTGYHTSKKRQRMKKNAGKRTSIGRLPTRQKRTV
jgi:mannosyltransferase